MIDLTRGRRVIIDEEDLEKIKDLRWYWMPNRCGIGYAASWSKGKTIYLHRFVMGNILKNRSRQIDHINRNTLDNRKINLRVATYSTNGMNRNKQQNNTSGFKGVCLDRGRWAARITQNKKGFFIGYFDSKEEAAMAYDLKAIELYGEFARLNNVIV